MTSRTAKGEDSAIKIVCTNCGGSLILPASAHEVRCQFCNHVTLRLRDLSRPSPDRDLFNDLYARQVNPAAWAIADYWLRCQGCGATMSPVRNRLAETCQFCGSRHVVKQSPQHKFSQPDLIVLFNIGEESARAAAVKALNAPSLMQRLWLRAPRPIIQIELSGAYLPFWLFSCAVRFPNEVRPHADGMVLLTDVPFFAGTMPPRALVEAVETFDLSAGVRFDPKLLGEYPAQLYSIDLDRAALDVRPKLHQKAIAKSLQRPHRVVNLDLSYRLALLPVWTLYAADVDGNFCQGVINGQTGKLRLSKWKPVR